MYATHLTLLGSRLTKMSSIEENLDFEPGGEDMERMKNVSEYVYNTWPSLKSLKQSEQVNFYVKSNKQEFFRFKWTELTLY